jgi:hypothetical protein
LIDDLLSNFALTVERVDRNNGAFEGKHSQQLGYGSDLIGLGIGGDLPQHHLLLAARSRSARSCG